MDLDVRGGGLVMSGFRAGVDFATGGCIWMLGRFGEERRATFDKFGRSSADHRLRKIFENASFAVSFRLLPKVNSTGRT